MILWSKQTNKQTLLTKSMICFIANPIFTCTVVLFPHTGLRMLLFLMKLSVGMEEFAKTLEPGKETNCYKY